MQSEAHATQLVDGLRSQRGKHTKSLESDAIARTRAVEQGLRLLFELLEIRLIRQLLRRHTTSVHSPGFAIRQHGGGRAVKTRWTVGSALRANLLAPAAHASSQREITTFVNDPTDVNDATA